MRKLTSFFFLATLGCCTFEKLHWSFGGQIALSDLLAIGFICCYVLVSRPHVPRTTAVLLAFGTVFVVVYLAGFVDISLPGGHAQFAKGFLKFVIHFVFLALGVAWLGRRGIDYYWRALTWFFGGLTVNAAYGVLQLAAAQLGFNLDSLLVSPLTGGASQINIYGAVNHAQVFRPNALTGDPNHLGIMLIVPLLVLTPLYLRLEPEHRYKRKLAALIGFMIVVEIATLSRSGLLGLAVGCLILVLPYSHYLGSRQLYRPILGALAVIVVVILTRLHYFIVVIKSRVQTGHASQSAHFQVYSFVPKILHSDPLLGLGLNNFSLYYQEATGKTNWGPHSFYVSLIVETGLVGTILFGVFLVWVFARLAVARRVGNALARAGNPLSRRVRPLAWGWTAALAGTMASNFFYLTMSFYYFFVFLTLALAVPLVFGVALPHRAERVPEPSPAGRRVRRSSPLPGPSPA